MNKTELRKSIVAILKKYKVEATSTEIINDLVELYSVKKESGHQSIGSGPSNQKR